MASEESWNRLEDGTGCQAPENHRLCANGCGFFGSPATLNLCSKCHRDHRIKEEQAASAKAAVEKSFSTTTMTPMASQVPISAAIACSSSSSSEVSTPNLSVGDSAVSVPQAAVKNRCQTCRKRVGLMGFTCRCGSNFCGSHRYPESHACTFDFKTLGRDAIAKANPVVKKDKVERF